MIVQRAGRTTFWARPWDIFGVIQIDVDLSFFQLQFHPLDLPWGLNSKNATIELSILHRTIFA
jgi:hypothetical protein